MSSPAEKLYEQALALPEDERLRLGEILLDSVPREMAEEIELAWSQEVLRRLEEIRSGKVEPLDWDEVRASLRAKFSRK
ncbi:MAG: addiction module protein [Deltaproteobacteria bacterium]|nr:addiction module protein [Deltaproteobacteria bacterium]